MRDNRAMLARIYRGLVVLLFGVVAVHLIDMQLLHSRDYAELAARNRQERVRVRAPRGRILSREGLVLADNVFKAGITLPRDALDPGEHAATLATLVRWFGLDSLAVRTRLEAQRAAGRSRLVLLPDAGMPQIAAVEERARELPGARVEARARRRYPYGSAFAHVIGYTGEVSAAEVDTAGDYPVYRPGDEIGREGVEAAREETLRGQAGWYLREVDARGRVVGAREVELVGVVPGGDVRLTLSATLQDSLLAAMAGRPGCAVALDLPSGDVLAAVSLPGYDANLFTRGISSAEWNALISDPLHPLLNRIVQATYPPGSPYKLVTSLCALTHGAAGPHTSFEPCWGSYRFGDRDFRCWLRTGHGPMDHGEALVHSCDVFYYQVVQDLSLEELRETALALGLGRATGSIFGGEAAGNLPDSAWYDEHYGRRHWSRGVLLNNAIGQGEILVTPLQMAVLTARIATGNGALAPRFVDDVPTPPPAPLPFREEHVRWVRHTMERVVDMGTGTRARLEAVDVAGKTGTAENPHGEDHAWFVCFAPAAAPRVALAVILEHAGHGGAVAAPVAARWLDAWVGWHAEQEASS